MILDSLESLKGVESIHIMLEAMGGHGKTKNTSFWTSLCSLCFMVMVMGGHVKDSKSHSGYVITLDGESVSWKSSKKMVISRSMMESKFMALMWGRG